MRMIEPDFLRVFDLHDARFFRDAAAESREQGRFARGRASDDQDAQRLRDQIHQAVDHVCGRDSPLDQEFGRNRLRLEQANVDTRISIPGRDDGMDDLDPRPAWQSFLARDLGVHRGRCLRNRPPQRRQQGLDRPPNIRPGGHIRQALERWGALTQHPHTAIRGNGNLG